MIDLESVSVEGFMSWGPYQTTLKLAEMEQCFVIGTVSDQAEGRSNGAGKSSLMQTIPWCLSGKTIYNQNPGDKILNWFSSGDAKVVLKFKNGDELTRIRTRQGNTELLFQRDSKEIINCTLSTTSNQQRVLDSELKFDYNLFCGSVFFSQYHRAWLAMPDQIRRQSFERIMGIDRLSIYAEVAKAKADRAILEQEKIKTNVTVVSSNIANLLKQLAIAQTSHSSFESSRTERHAAKLRDAVEYEDKANKCVLIDLIALSKKWAVVEKINTKIVEIQTQIAEADTNIANAESVKLRATMQLREAAQARKNQILQSVEVERTKLRTKKEEDIKKKESEVDTNNQEVVALHIQISEQKGIVNTQDAIIKQWTAKSGKVCTECERELPEEYANSKIDGPKNLKTKAECKIETLGKTVGGIKNKIVEINSGIEKIKSVASVAIASLSEKSVKETSEIDEQLQKDIAKAVESSAVVKSDIQSKKLQLEQLVSTTKFKLTSIKPDLTFNEAVSRNSQRQTLLDAAHRAREDSDRIAAEQNTHAESIIELGKEIREQEARVDTLTKSLATYDIILNHLQYIHKAYSDRKKIKSYLIGKHQPYFNTRLHHYLDLFNLDIKISLTDSLGIESNLWGYDFQSGGERGRTDLAFMFAVFDLHQGIHGPQSNVLVLDEPEKALDEAGRQTLISVIKDDLATRFETIFIISHSDCFRDVFPHQITVERTDRFSHITDIR